MYGAQLQLLHDILQRRQPARDVLGLVRKRFQKPRPVLLAVQSHDEGFQHQRRHPCVPSHQPTFSGEAHALLSMQNDDAADELRRDVRLQHVDY